MAYVGSNVKIELAATYSTAITVTGISKAAEGVVTATNTLANGDVVLFTVTAGMVELDGQACRVKSVSGSSFTLEGLDTQAYSTWTACTCVKVATWTTFSSSRTITMPNPAPNKLDVTTLLDIVKKTQFGLPEAPDGSITALLNPGGGAETLVTTATNTNARMPARVTWQGVAQTVFNAYWSGGAGFDAQQGGIVESTVSFTPVGRVMQYAS